MPEAMPEQEAEPQLMAEGVICHEPVAQEEPDAVPEQSDQAGSLEQRSVSFEYGPASEDEEDDGTKGAESWELHRERVEYHRMLEEASSARIHGLSSREIEHDMAAAAAAAAVEDETQPAAEETDSAEQAGGDAIANYLAAVEEDRPKEEEFRRRAGEADDEIERHQVSACKFRFISNAVLSQGTAGNRISSYSQEFCIRASQAHQKQVIQAHREQESRGAAAGAAATAVAGEALRYPDISWEQLVNDRADQGSEGGYATWEERYKARLEALTAVEEDEGRAEDPAMAGDTASQEVLQGTQPAGDDAAMAPGQFGSSEDVVDGSHIHAAPTAPAPAAAAEHAAAGEEPARRGAKRPAPAEQNEEAAGQVPPRKRRRSRCSLGGVARGLARFAAQLLLGAPVRAPEPSTVGPQLEEPLDMPEVASAAAQTSAAEPNAADACAGMASSAPECPLVFAAGPQAKEARDEQAHQEEAEAQQLPTTGLDEDCMHLNEELINGEQAQQQQDELPDQAAEEACMQQSLEAALDDGLPPLAAEEGKMFEAPFGSDSEEEEAHARAAAQRGAGRLLRRSTGAPFAPMCPFRDAHSDFLPGPVRHAAAARARAGAA